MNVECEEKVEGGVPDGEADRRKETWAGTVHSALGRNLAISLASMMLPLQCNDPVNTCFSYLSIKKNIVF